jgi:hypothetical protein
LRGFAPPALGPVTIRAFLDKTPLGERATPPGEFIHEFVLPDNWKQESAFPLWIESSKTMRPPGDGRTLSLVFGEIGIR